MLESEPNVVCALNSYDTFSQSEQRATVGVLRQLLNRRDGINMIKCFKYDEVTLVITPFYAKPPAN